jgi:hypothetical protein
MAETIPAVFLTDGHELARLRHRLNDPDLEQPLRHLRTAMAALPSGTWSVMDKPFVPPSGDKHDYLTLTPYWWPNPDTADGLPYVYRDGEVNPEIAHYDRHRLDSLVWAVQTLALAAYLYDDDAAVRRAEQLLRVFLLDEATRMNPSMRFGQFIPGRAEGTPASIVDARVVVPLAEAVALLRACDPPLTETTARGCAAWFASFLDWLLTGEHGRRAGETHNNHATMYDLEVAALALHLGRRDLAEQTLRDAGPRRIAAQVEPDGSQPHELSRTRSWTYSTLNASLLCRLARLGEHVDAGLWTYQGPEGGSIRDALDFILRHAHDLPTSWPRPQLTGFEPDPLALALRLALRAWPEEGTYRRALVEVSALPKDDENAPATPGLDGLLVRLPLLYPLPDAAE